MRTAFRLFRLPERTGYSDARLFATLFLAYSLATTLTTAWIMPVAANGDEMTHFARADQISMGEFVGHRDGPTSTGGTIHLAIVPLTAMLWPVMTDNSLRLTRQLSDEAHDVDWGPTGYHYFANTAIYPPTSYGPAVLGILLGRAFHFKIVVTLLLARMITAGVCTMIGTTAVAVAGDAAPFIFLLLLLPMSLVQMSAITQDGVMIALSALAAALAVVPLRDGQPVQMKQFAVIAACLTLIVLARPPYIPLLGILLILRGPSRRVRITTFIVCGAVIAGWYGLVRMQVFVPLLTDEPNTPPDSSAQIAYLLHNPGQVFGLIKSTQLFFVYGFEREFVGLGPWSLPRNYYHAALLALVFTLLMLTAARSLYIAPDITRYRISRSFAVLMILSAAVVSIFATFYLTWTRPGAPYIHGVQGRYFIPLAFFVPAMLPRIGWMPSFHTFGRYCVMVFPAVSIIVLIHAIIWRFYLT